MKSDSSERKIIQHKIKEVQNSTEVPRLLQSKCCRALYDTEKVKIELAHRGFSYENSCCSPRLCNDCFLADKK